MNEYDAEFFKGVDDMFAIRPHTRRDADQRLLERLIPDPVFLRQLQAFFDAQPGFAQRFPGGIVQFAQMAGELPEDALEDLMIAEAMGNGELNRDMPGAMPGEELIFAEDIDVNDETEPPTEAHAPAPVGNDGGAREVVQDAESAQSGGDEDEESSEEEIAPLPVRLIRNIMNRFWGVNSWADTEDTSEDEDNIANRPVNDGGVD